MDQILATYANRRNTSLPTSEASTTLPSMEPRQWETLAKKHNIPGFLLLDAVRFYKRGQTAQATLTPIVNSVKEDVANVKKDMDILVQNNGQDQKRLGRVEASVTAVSTALERLEEDLDTVRRDNLRTNLSATKNGQDVGGLAVKLEALERQLSGLRARERNDVQLRAEIHGLAMDLSAVVASIQRMGVPSIQNQLAGFQGNAYHEQGYSPNLQAQNVGYYSQVPQAHQVDDTRAGLLAFTKHSANKTTQQYQNQLPRRFEPSFGYITSAHGAATNALPRPSQHTMNPDLGDETASDASEAVIHGYNPSLISRRCEYTAADTLTGHKVTAYQEITTSLAGRNQQTTSSDPRQSIAPQTQDLCGFPNPGDFPDPRELHNLGPISTPGCLSGRKDIPDHRDETASIASDNNLSVITEGTAVGAAKAHLINLLIQAERRYDQDRPLRNHSVFIWKFLTSIEDKDLSKRVQLFLLARLETRLVRKVQASMRKRMEQTNRFIYIQSMLKWPEFVKTFREFLKGGLL